MQYRYEDFNACLDQPLLLLQLEDGSSESMRLVQVDLIRTAEENGGRESFSILLQGDGPEILHQDTYAFSSDQLGDFQLFIVPVGQDETGVQYEAVFS